METPNIKKVKIFLRKTQTPPEDNFLGGNTKHQKGQYLFVEKSTTTKGSFAETSNIIKRSRPSLSSVLIFPILLDDLDWTSFTINCPLTSTLTVQQVGNIYSILKKFSLMKLAWASFLTLRRVGKCLGLCHTCTEHFMRIFRFCSIMKIRTFILSFHSYIRKMYFSKSWIEVKEAMKVHLKRQGWFHYSSSPLFFHWICCFCATGLSLDTVFGVSSYGHIIVGNW